jgi:hypothetical protein
MLKLETPPTTQQTPSQPLKDQWLIHYHYPNDKNWDISSYKLVLKIKTVEDLVSLNENMPENIIKYCMLFVMRNGINPMWEDPKNKDGGCFSYKISNKNVVSVWKQMMYALCGETLMSEKENMKYVNGITISPKKNFCILKIWLANLKLQNSDLVINIPCLSKLGVLFKSHK